MGSSPPTEPSVANSIDVFTGGLALLAFVMALYALAAREQKTPYITNSVYSTALIVLIAIFFSTTGKLLYFKYPQAASSLAFLGSVTLGIGVINVFFRVWEAQNRKLNFRNDHLFRNLKLVRWSKNISRSLRHRPTYEHDPVGLHEPLLQSIMQCRSLPEMQLKKALDRRESIDSFALSLSAACRVSTLSEGDSLLTELAMCFFEHRCWVQYTTCTRHPIEYVLQLKKAWQAVHKDKDWKQTANHIITVDAYSPHFGFTDSIHDEATKRLRELGVDCITSKASYAGMHTAAARAFNIIKARSREEKGQPIRQPTLVIYEGPNALAELESGEQYRIFIRHLVPSERLWGGMFTLVIESAVNEQDLALLRSYTDLFVDLSGKPLSDSQQTEERSGA